MDAMMWLGILIVCVQAVFAIALLQFAHYFRRVIEELRREARALDRVRQSNQNVVYWLAQRTGTSVTDEEHA